MDVSEKLRILADKGDALAAYYLAKHYSEHRATNEAIYWLFRSIHGGCSSASALLGSLQSKHPEKVRSVKKNLPSEYSRCFYGKNI